MTKTELYYKITCNYTDAELLQCFKLQAYVEDLDVDGFDLDYSV